MKRFKHNLSHDHLFSCDMGQLIPISCMEVLAGDAMQVQSSMLIRVTPQLKPLMHSVTAHVKHFFVPNRIIWSGWEDFITGESATPPPTITGGAHTEGDLSDYLGVYDDASNDFSALPVRAYNAIYNNFFRDQDLVTEVSEDSNVIQKVAWAKDYYTAARPWALKGDAITLPLGESAPIYADAQGATTKITVDNLQGGGDIDLGTGTSNLQPGSTADGRPLMVDLSSATGVDIRDFREAFALQRYQEARARYGSDYVDYLNYIGVNGRKLDARLQKPEFLGGGRQRVQFSEVLNTAANGGVDAIGEFGGHGIAALRSNRIRRYFPEHGWLISLVYIRPKSVYVNGLHRKFSKTTKEDYFQKELESIGQQEILNKEVYAAHSTPDGTFGYSDRYAEYRSEPSRVSAEFRNSTSYDWHLGRIFSSDPSLNQTFIECDPTKRCFAEQSNDSLWIVAHNSIQARRMVSNRSVGSVL